MREGLLADSTDYASKKLKDHLKRMAFLFFVVQNLMQLHNIIECATKADQVFLPVLENAEKAQKLRSTLGVFERSKFFFNLPGSLMELKEAVS